MQHAHHRVPVTALAFWSDHVILAGEGHLLKAYDVPSKTLLARVDVFKSQSIHGIVLSETSGARRVLAYGGSLACQVTISTTTDAHLAFRCGPVQDAKDWILDAAPRNTHAHQFAVLTAHNALSIATLGEHLETSIKPVLEGSNCILYSANIKWLSASKCLIASGTAFGDVIIWSSRLSTEDDGLSAICHVHYTFSAHRGSVFGVQISSPDVAGLLGGRDHLLATCSDDRTIRLWDISDLSAESLSLSGEQRQTGFGSDPSIEKHAPPLLAKVIGGHLSRIWHVRFVGTNRKSEAPTSAARCIEVSLLSFGEDACRVEWGLEEGDKSSESLPYAFKQIASLNAHAGKNIWSVALDRRLGILSGAADGAFILQPCSTVKSSITQDEISAASEDAIDTCRAYAFVGSRKLLTSTDSGRLLLLSVERKAFTSVQEVSQAIDGLRGYSVIASTDGVAFLAGKTGTIYAYTTHSNKLSKILDVGRKVAGLFVVGSASTHDRKEAIHLLSTTVGGSSAILCELEHVVHTGQVVLSSQMEIQLPTGFVVTSSIRVLECGTVVVVIGSRSGSIAVCSFPENDRDGSVSPCLMRDLVHGRESVTCLQAIPRASDGKRTIILSTGRDGTYATHEIRHSDDHEVSMTTIHQLSLPFGPNIEGIGMSLSGHLRVWGFRSKQFVVYDIDEQQEIMTVDCGGAHRNWSFQMNDNGGSLVWTKASKIYARLQEELSFTPFNSGGHGREIKATAVSPTDRHLIATGAEDTNIKLSRFYDRGFRCLHTLRKHNTGIQHLRWSSDGQYLFSSGGFEEFCVWKISTRVPGLSLGVLCESSHPKSGTSDLRVMHFDVSMEYMNDARADGFRIWMAYSDSTIRLWQYYERAWSLLATGDYLTSCLTQCVELRTDVLLTGSTDGHIASWSTDLAQTTTTWTQRQKIHQSAILSMITIELADQSHLLLTGGDDNAIGITRRMDSGDVRNLLVPSAHAAAVTGLMIVRIEIGSLWLLSASLDQRVKLWRISTDFVYPGIDGVDIKLVSNVLTAVADVSGLERVALGDGKTGVLIAGVGMDVWRLAIDGEDD